MKNKTIGYAKFLTDSGNLWIKDKIYEVRGIVEDKMVVSTEDNRDVVIPINLYGWELADTIEKLETPTAKDVLKKIVDNNTFSCSFWHSLLNKEQPDCLGVGEDCNQCIKDIIDEL